MEFELDDCPFCNKETVFETDFIWNNKDAVRCGCRTLGCRGHIKDAPVYVNFGTMATKWNQRGGIRKLQ